MQVTETLSEGLSREFSVVVPAADLDRELDVQLDSIKDQVRIKGFRPGKAPKSYLRSLYGKQVMGDVITKTVNESSKKVLEEREMVPAGQPAIEITSYEEGGDLAYKMALDLMPTIPEQDFSVVTLDRPVLDDSGIEAEVAATLDRLAAANRSFTPKGDDAIAADGDQVTIDFLGRVDGVAFDGGTAEDYALVLGSGSFIPGFEAQIVGAATGQKLDVNVTFPAEYPAEELAGKDAVFEVTVKSVSAPGDTVIDDSLAAQFGMDTLDALKVAIRGQVSNEMGSASRARVKRQLLDALDGLFSFELPKRMVENEAKAIAHQLWHDENPDVEGHEHPEVETTDEHMTLANRRVRLGLVLAEVGRKNNIQVTEEEVRQRVLTEARRYPGREKEFLDFISKNQEMLNQFQAPLYEDKVVDFILEIAKVTEVPVSKEELLRDPDEEDAPAAEAAAKPAKKKAAKKKTEPEA